MDCPLQLIQTAQMSQEAGSALLVDTPAQIVVELADQPPQAHGTSPGAWQTTTEPRIVVMLNTTEIPGLSQIQSEEVDPFLVIAMSRMFLEYRLNQQGSTDTTLMEQHECRQQLADLSRQHIVWLAAGKFMQ